MSDTGKQSPLGVNSVNSLLNVQGLNINPKFVSWAGTSHNFGSYSFGRVCQETVLRVITHAIHEGYVGHTDIAGTDGWPTQTVYNNLISIGGGTNAIPITNITSGVISGTDQFYFDVTYNQSFVLVPGTYVRINGANPAGYNGNWLIETGSAGTFRVYTTASYGVSTTGSFVIDTQVPALGNTKAMVYTWEEMIGRFGTGTFNLGDYKGWGGSLYKNNRPLPVDGTPDTTNPATQWAYVRLLALQAWMEFNYNSTLERGDSLNPAGYRDFVQQWQSAYGFIGYSNNAILSVDNSKDFLEGTYSNMNDLISGDITNVSLATKAFGQDLIALGKAIDLSTIATYGLPSNLLKTLVKYNALTKNLSLAIIAAGIPVDELGAIISNVSQPTKDQERNLYAAYYITVGETLNEVLVPLNCKTQGLSSLADLLDPSKMFPNSYKTLTVQLYNTGTQNGAQNSKIAFPIYTSSGTINPDLTSSTVLNQVGIQTPVGTPLINDIVQPASATTDAAIALNDITQSITSPADIRTAGTAYNTFKNSNLKQVATSDLNSILVNATQQALPSAVRTNSYYPGYGTNPNNIANDDSIAIAEATKQSLPVAVRSATYFPGYNASDDSAAIKTPGGGKAYDSFNNEAK